MKIPWKRIPWYPRSRRRPGESLLRAILRAISVRIIGYSLILLILAPLNCCNGMFYQPSRELFSLPSDLNDSSRVEEVWFTSKDGTRLNAWFLHAMGEAKGTVLHFHGNAGNLSGHVDYVSWLPLAGFNVLVWDYRGYGKSEGSPARSGIHDDGIAALEYLRSRQDIDASRIAVFGQSLGGAVALDTVLNSNRKGIACVIVDSTFASYQSQANSFVGGTPFTFPFIWALVGESCSPGSQIAAIAPVPILVIHGTADRIVAFELGQEVFELAREPKVFWEIPGGGHTDAFGLRGATWRPRLTEYLTNCLDVAQHLSSLANPGS